jgi:hypothetical protein
MHKLATTRSRVVTGCYFQALNMSNLFSEGYTEVSTRLEEPAKEFLIQHGWLHSRKILPHVVVSDD